MKRIGVAYLVTLVIFVAVDSVWLSTMADKLYRPIMGDMLLDEFRIFPAISFYLLYAAGAVFLAVRPGLASGSAVNAAIHGAVLGFTAYATYDLTNQATLKNWSSLLTIADIVWGSLLTAVSAGAACLATRRFMSMEKSFGGGGR